MTSDKLIKFVNCKILKDHKVYEDQLWVKNGKIINPQEIFFKGRVMADEVIDLQGAIIAPGFIDIQLNGGFGIDFTHDLVKNPNGLGTVAQGILAHGVTAFCPTVVTSRAETYEKVLKLLIKQKGGSHGAEVLGCHVEGPFINYNKKGAHCLEYISEFTNGVSSLLEMYKDLSNVKVVTLAPEKKNSLEVIEWLRDRNITVCLGHSEADVEVGEVAVSRGANVITHLFNAMLPFHHRNPGLVGLLGANNLSVFYGIIADEVHTHPSALRIAYKAHPAGAILVTDAISAMGLPEGTHHIGDKVIDVRGECAFVANTNILCGSRATMDKCIKNFKKATSCTTAEVLEAASLHPATALGINDKKGTLNFGSDADFVVLNEQLDVLSTWISGECVFREMIAQGKHILLPLQRKIDISI